MSSTTKKLLGGIVVLGIIGAAFASYMLRPLPPPTETATTTSSNTPVSTNPDEAVYRISSEKSVAQFEIAEVLRGEDFLVVGTTSNLQGELVLNTKNPNQSELGIIKVNARTLKTDSASRNAAIGRAILQSDKDEYEFIEFVPTSLVGLPENITVGDTVSFKVTGGLRIAGITKPVTFDITMKVEENQISGKGETTVLYKDFDISIPSVPFVASVEDEVKLIINFVAEKV